MGCDFYYYNSTNGKDYHDGKNYLLNRNINRGTTTHLYNAICKVIKLCNWDLKDEIEISCCCNFYEFKNGILRHIYDDEWKVIPNDGCYIENCSVCKD